jgi:PAS domain S-box-containing protein
LTAREREILDLMCAGLTSATIAERLELTVGVVKNWRRGIYQKLGVTGRDEACAAFGLDGGATGRAGARTADGARRMPQGRPRIQTFPVHDDEFRTFVRRMATDAPPTMGAVQFEDRLRHRYPTATVRLHRRTRSRSDPGSWYVFRAAHMTDPSEDAWWERQSDAWLDLDPTGVMVDISPDAESLLGLSRDVVIGRTIFDPLAPMSHEAEEDIRRLWAGLQTRGEVRSSFRYPRSDGAVIDLDFYVARSTGSDARFRATLRAIRPVARAS